jgi:hypothetical protein
MHWCLSYFSNIQCNVKKGTAVPVLATKEVSNQHHAPATLPRIRIPDTHCIAGWVGPRNGLTVLKNRKIFDLPGSGLRAVHSTSLPLRQARSTRSSRAKFCLRHSAMLALETFEMRRRLLPLSLAKPRYKAENNFEKLCAVYIQRHTLYY